MRDIESIQYSGPCILPNFCYYIMIHVDPAHYGTVSNISKAMLLISLFICKVEICRFGLYLIKFVADNIADHVLAACWCVCIYICNKNK